MRWFRKLWRGPKLVWRDMKTDPAPRDGSLCLFFDRAPNGPGSDDYYAIASWGKTSESRFGGGYETWLEDGHSDRQNFWINPGCEGGEGATHWLLLAAPPPIPEPAKSHAAAKLVETFE